MRGSWRNWSRIATRSRVSASDSCRGSGVDQPRTPRRDPPPPSGLSNAVGVVSARSWSVAQQIQAVAAAGLRPSHGWIRAGSCRGPRVDGRASRAPDGELDPTRPWARRAPARPVDPEQRGQQGHARSLTAGETIDTTMRIGGQRHRGDHVVGLTWCSTEDRRNARRSPARSDRRRSTGLKLTETRPVPELRPIPPADPAPGRGRPRHAAPHDRPHQRRLARTTRTQQPRHRTGHNRARQARDHRPATTDHAQPLDLNRVSHRPSHQPDHACTDRTLATTDHPAARQPRSHRHLAIAPMNDATRSTRAPSEKRRRTRPKCAPTNDAAGVSLIAVSVLSRADLRVATSGCLTDTFGFRTRHPLSRTNALAPSYEPLRRPGSALAHAEW